MKRKLTKITSVFLGVVMLCSLFVTTGFASSYSWIDESLLYNDRYLTSAEEYALTSNLIERDIVLNNKAKSNQIRGYVIEVDLSNPDVYIAANYNDADLDGIGMATVSSQASAYEKKNGVNVIAAVNGSGYNTKTGEVTGLLVMNGVIGHPSQDGSNRPFFAILKDGTPVIRTADGRTDDVAEAVSGMAILVVDGKVISSGDTKVHPRTAVGIKADGSVVFLVADGRQSPDSCGMVYDDLSSTMLALGCVNAMALDGGGSSTMLAEREGTNSLETINTPCYGFERAVGSSLVICTKATATGVFDHVAFSQPTYEVAPYSYVGVSYWGVDTNGYAVDLPSNGKLELSDDSLGSVVGSKFYANGNEGTVTFNYVVDDVVVGTATVEITKEADDVITTILKDIRQMIANFFNLIDFVLEKFGLKTS